MLRCVWWCRTCKALLLNTGTPLDGCQAAHRVGHATFRPTIQQDGGRSLVKNAEVVACWDTPSSSSPTSGSTTGAMVACWRQTYSSNGTPAARPRYALPLRPAAPLPAARQARPRDALPLRPACPPPAARLRTAPAPLRAARRPAVQVPLARLRAVPPQEDTHHEDKHHHNINDHNDNHSDNTHEDNS